MPKWKELVRIQRNYPIRPILYSLTTESGYDRSLEELHVVETQHTNPSFHSCTSLKTFECSIGRKMIGDIDAVDDGKVVRKEVVDDVELVLHHGDDSDLHP